MKPTLALAVIAAGLCVPARAQVPRFPAPQGKETAARPADKEKEDRAKETRVRELLSRIKEGGAITKEERDSGKEQLKKELAKLEHELKETDKGRGELVKMLEEGVDKRIAAGKLPKNAKAEEMKAIREQVKKVLTSMKEWNVGAQKKLDEAKLN